MVSWEGFETWLDYEFLFLKVGIVLAVAAWLVRTLSGVVADAGIPVGRLVVSASVALVLASVGAAWWIGRHPE